MKSRSFTDLTVWREAHKFVLDVYRATDAFPKHELFGLTSQFRRAAVSIPANIAEGFKRRGNAEKIRFYNISQASIEECRYYLILAGDLGYVDETRRMLDDLDIVGRILAGYSRSIPIGRENRNRTDG